MKSTLVTPGQVITTEAGFLRGHGTYLSEGNGDEDQEMDRNVHLIASVAGQIERMNKLIFVKPIKTRYLGEVGDLLVGRISMVESKRWKVDIAGHRDAMLQLSSITLPGGVQRMRTYEDQLQMRTLFEEGDLLCAEIQNINAEGTVSLHTRSLKYGKLENGQLVIVPSYLIKRLPQHYVSFPTPQCPMDLIFGKNGFIWISRSIPEAWKEEAGTIDDITPLAETLQNLKLRHNQTPYTLDERLMVARLHNAIRILANHHLQISPESVYTIYTKSIELKIEPKVGNKQD